MRHEISDTAEYGDYTRGPTVIDASVRRRLREILTEIQDGTLPMNGSRRHVRATDASTGCESRRGTIRSSRLVPSYAP